LQLHNVHMGPRNVCLMWCWKTVLLSMLDGVDSVSLSYSY
jgi:hypothetical protein